jgi:SAM-dependent methyltransferase
VNSRSLERQRKSFDDLVDSGVYSADFDHAPAAKAFVDTVLRQIVARLNRQAPLKVLDCGCGTGAWLAFLHDRLVQAGVTDLRLCGFDLSERMVEVAREKLRGLAAPADVRPGNVLELASFAPADLGGGFDLIFTYDVVQQLPRARQLDACLAIAEALSPGGVALIFDNDAQTRFGRRMGWRKFLTRYFGLRLVPRYYCNASYPPLERFRRRIADDAALRAENVVRADGVKRALIVARGTAAALEGETPDHE